MPHRLVPNMRKQTGQLVVLLSALQLYRQRLLETDVLTQQVRLASEWIYRKLLEVHHQDFLNSKGDTGYLAMTVRLVIVV